MFHLVQSSDRLQVAAESVTSAAPEAVWALVADATRYPQWGPWSAAGYRGAPGHVPGAVYWLRSASRVYGRYVTTVERVEEIDQGRRLVYSVVGGMPVRGYRGEVTLTPSPEGTRSCGGWCCPEKVPDITASAAPGMAGTAAAAQHHPPGEVPGSPEKDKHHRSRIAGELAGFLTVRQTPRMRAP